MVLKEFLQKKKGQGSERNKDEDIVVGNGLKRIGAFRLRALFNELDLSDNELSGSIPSFIGNMTSLVELNLDNNQLDG